MQHLPRIAGVVLSITARKWLLFIANNYLCFYCFGEDVLDIVEARILLSFTDQPLIVHRYSMVSNVHISFTFLRKS